MTNRIPDPALTALLALGEDETPPLIEDAHSLPNLNERADLFLRAVYGPNHTATLDERTAARSKILSAMAAELGGEPDRNAGDVIQRTAATTSVSAQQTEEMTSAGARPAGLTLARLGEILRDAFLWPITSISNGPMRLAMASVVMLMIVGAGWTGAWFYAAKTTEKILFSWIDLESKSGQIDSCSSRTVGGFPFRIELSCIDPKATLASAQSTHVVTAKEMRAFASIFGPSTVTAEISGPVSVSEPGNPVTFVGNWTSARTVLRGTSNPEILATFDEIQFYKVTQISMEPLLTSERIEIEGRPDSLSTSTKPVFDIALRVKAGTLPSSGQLASELFSAEMTAALHETGGTAPKAWSTRLRDWQAAGGQLAVRTARVHQGQASATLNGSVGLNNNGRVDGSFQMSTTGAYALLAQSFIAERERIAGSAIVDPSSRMRSIGDTRALTAPALPNNRTELLPAPRNQTGPGSTRSLEIPIRFVDGVMYFGPVQVGVIPPLF